MVITDYQMKNMDGIELRDLIRDGNRNIPIILMTGERDHNLQNGFDGEVNVQEQRRYDLLAIYSRWSNTCLTFAARSSIPKGFWIKLTPSSRMP